MFKINPLNILKKRRLSFVPPHFSKIQIQNHDLFFDTDLIKWIDTKLNGRYTIVNLPYVTSEGKSQTGTFAAFEDPRELTYFMLACPHLRRN